MAEQQEELHVNFGINNTNLPTENLEDVSYTQRQGRDYYRSTPLETITVEGKQLTYREARNLLMQDGLLRTYFRRYKGRCNGEHRPNHAGFAPSCNSLPFKGDMYSVEHCILNLLNGPDGNDAKQELLDKLNNTSKYSWRENVTRSSWKDPRLSIKVVRGERAPQRLRAEIEEGGSIKPIHTVANHTTQEGARKHRKNLNRIGPYLTERNRERLGQIITNNIDRLGQQLPTFTFVDAAQIRHNDDDEWKQVRINYQEDNDIPDGTNIQVEDEDNTYNVLALPNNVDSSFDVILPDDAGVIAGFTVAQSIVPKSNWNMGQNKFGSRRKHIISTGNANGTYGVPILLAHAGITRKDSTRSTRQRKMDRKERICHGLNINSRVGKEEHAFRSCNRNPDDGYVTYVNEEEMYDSHLQYFNDNWNNTRKYNFDEAMDIMMSPDTRFRTGPTPFETIWQQGRRDSLDDEVILDRIETEIIRILEEAKNDNNRITGTRLLNYLQNEYPTAYTWSGEVQQPGAAEVRPARAPSFVFIQPHGYDSSSSSSEGGSDSESEDGNDRNIFDSEVESEDDEVLDDNTFQQRLKNPGNFFDEEAFPSLVMKNGGKLARRTSRKKKKASKKSKL